MQMNRRLFFGLTGGALAATAQTNVLDRTATADRWVKFFGDGLWLSPSAQMQVLSKLMQDGKIESDFYCKGGTVAKLESRMASLLGKEAAIFLPTGTMANRLALQVLAGNRRRILLLRESHTFNDEGDGPQLLSGDSLVPLAPGKATFTLEEVKAEMARFSGGPGPVPVGVIAMECPVRRQEGRLFDFAEMQAISSFARENKIGMHLDGARLLIASCYSGISPERYAALFDTVYISLYKYLNAMSGAILAGSRNVIEQISELRQVSGGMIYDVWPQASLALYHLDSFQDRFAKAIARAEELVRLLQKNPRFHIEKIPGGTNIAYLHVDVEDAKLWAKRLLNLNIAFFPPEGSQTKVLFMTNETLFRQPVEILSSSLISALS